MTFPPGSAGQRVYENLRECPREILGRKEDPGSLGAGTPGAQCQGFGRVPAARVTAQQEPGYMASFPPPAIKCQPFQMIKICRRCGRDWGQRGCTWLVAE